MGFKTVQQKRKKLSESKACSIGARETIKANRFLEKNVHMLGYREDILSILKMSDLLAFPSLWEGMSNVVLEAMACKKAVLGYEISGNQTLLAHQKQHQLISINEPQVLVKKQFTLFSEGLLESLGEENRKVIEQKYSIECITDAYLTNFARFLSPRSMS